ncbi:EsaB/YukD family protein [Micromonospora sp. M12]
MAPRTRMDLALPSDVPMADLLPTLLRYAGEDMADEGARHGGWALSRLGGAPLDGGRTVAQLGVRDGEVLYFNPRSAAARRSSSTTWWTRSPPRPTNAPVPGRPARRGPSR